MALDVEHKKWQARNDEDEGITSKDRPAGFTGI
jgi:hypothetical protein